MFLTCSCNSPVFNRCLKYATCEEESVISFPPFKQLFYGLGRVEKVMFLPPFFQTKAVLRGLFEWAIMQTMT